MKTKLERPVRPERLESANVPAFNLKVLGEELLSEPAVEKSGRTAVTLVEHAGVTVVLTAMSEGAKLKEHAAKGPVSITCIAGEMDLASGDQVVTLATGQMLAMSPGARHSVQAKTDCVFQIIIGPQ